MKIKKRILSLALTGAMTLGLMPGMSMTALADTPTSYTLTIPSTLTVANKGWNGTDGISATGTLESGKKLTVTASSDGEFALVSGDNKVNYKLAASGDKMERFSEAAPGSGENIAIPGYKKLDFAAGKTAQTVRLTNPPENARRILSIVS